MECDKCGNILTFNVVVIFQKVFRKTYDEDGDLVESILNKSSAKKLETIICAECGHLLSSDDSTSDITLEDTNTLAKTKKKKAKPKKKPHKPDGDGKPTEKQLKYLFDLADILEIPDEEREGFKKLSKKEISAKLTEYYKECKKRGIE